MNARQAELTRKTKETDITARMILDGKAERLIDTGIGFFDHMLDHLSKHSGISLRVEAKGDLDVDFHHTVEDVGIVLGELLLDALGESRGIARYGSVSVPMEETLADCAIDLCGRGALVYNVPVTQPKVGEFDSELGHDFFQAISRSGKFCLHLNIRYGKNQHHILEVLFKAFAQALKQAIALTGSDEIPSTKGVL
ncbi:MAG: imidazoleglycerol-phosphate dehydratase HisB [Candidatus Omnitrophica bacterium]|nr:imidazoleglycerol-phosphate dehydratase HisB [Candidatus Omnitrophota bacterium]